MFQRINEKFRYTNQILSAEKAYKDSVQLNLNTTQIYPIIVSSNDIGKAKTIFSVPSGSTYYFLSASYNGIDDNTDLQINFPGNLAVANISSPFSFSSVANPILEGEVKVLVNNISTDSEVTINLCVLTE